ncbi:MAG: HIT family protein [Bryobacteraceae bacterium]|nr:HIT family protein [Bryobacteraceae bacterium]
MKPCVFCAIARGEAAADVVMESPDVVAFLDHRPLFPGHVLVIPREHIATLGDLGETMLPHLFGSVQRVARAVESALPAQGSFVALNNRVSQSVPHLHVHVVPRNARDGLKGFFWPRTAYRDDDHRARVAGLLRRALE